MSSSITKLVRVFAPGWFSLASVQSPPENRGSSRVRIILVVHPIHDVDRNNRATTLLCLYGCRWFHQPQRYLPASLPHRAAAVEFSLVPTRSTGKQPDHLSIRSGIQATAHQPVQCEPANR